MAKNKIVSKAKLVDAKKNSKVVAKPAAKKMASPAVKNVSKKATPAASKAALKAAPKAAIKASAKPVTKPVAKPVVKLAAKAAVNASVKPSALESKSSAKSAVKNLAKAAVKSVSKVAEKVVVTASLLSKKSETQKIDKKSAKISEVNEPSMGSTLIEMAKEEMAAVKIGQTADKVEKASKFKAIKVERGNLADEKAKWQELFKRHGKDKAYNYKMSDTFESAKPIQHKVLGWGFILTNDNDRLEVLFENGIKMLISNYKPN